MVLKVLKIFYSDYVIFFKNKLTLQSQAQSCQAGHSKPDIRLSKRTDIRPVRPIMQLGLYKQWPETFFYRKQLKVSFLKLFIMKNKLCIGKDVFLTKNNLP